jgi:glucoamylase
MTATLNEWIDAQTQISAERMALVVSATSLVKTRKGFAQVVTPARGSVLAAPTVADVPPDYFFHWARDSAAIMDAAIVLVKSGIRADQWLTAFEDFVEFSLSLRDIDGPRFLAEVGDFRSSMNPDFLQFVRPDDELAAVEGDRVPGDVRYSADGKLDFIRWNRPQHDGPAARALTGIRAMAAGISSSRKAEMRLADLIRGDLDYTLRNAGDACFDVWEEENARHYYTVLLQHTALLGGSEWAAARGEHDFGGCLKRAAGELVPLLDSFWSAEKGYFRSRIFADGSGSPKDPDFAVLMGVLHAGLADGPHSARDPRVLATLKASEALFTRTLGINKGRTAGLAYGRYDGDDYVGGGAWYFCTLAAAELYYRRGEVAAGDAIFEHVRATLPANGAMTEQFDRNTAAQTSAPDLGWSYAAFITAAEARRSRI